MNLRERPTLSIAPAVAEMLVTLNTSAAAIRAHYRRNNGVLRVEIAKSVSASELIGLARLHAREIYGEQLAQIVCQHQNMTARHLAALDRILPKSLGLANAIATSGKAPLSLLRRYATRRDRHLREHAKLALLSRSLDGAGVRKFRRILDRSGGDSPSAMARRSIVLTHPSTPVEVLAGLLSDPIDSFAREASRRLGRKRGPTRTT